MNNDGVDAYLLLLVVVLDKKLILLLHITIQAAAEDNTYVVAEGGKIDLDLDFYFSGGAGCARWAVVVYGGAVAGGTDLVWRIS